MNRKRWFLKIVGLIGFALAFYCADGFRPLETVKAKSLSGLGALTGKVDAPKPFKAAQVYAENMDKNILYMVYTYGGRYRAVDLIPGNYELSAKTNGLASDVQKFEVKAGSSLTMNLRMHEAETEPQHQAYFADPRRDPKQVFANLKFATYDEMFPAGRERSLMEKTCIECHGVNFFALNPRTQEKWTETVGIMATAGRLPMFTPEDRQMVIAYLAKNFGPESPRRYQKIDKPFPVDEQALSKAMYIEYFAPLDPKLDVQGNIRRIHEAGFDKDGDAWYGDYSDPNRIGRLDPRTGKWKDWLVPPKTDPQTVVVDKDGIVWWAEVTGFHLGRLDPKTDVMKRFDVDPEGKIKGGQLHSVILDPDENLWFTAIVGNKIGKFDTRTEKLSLFDLPTPNAMPYGLVMDQNRNIWVSELRACKLAKFETTSEKWTEYLPLTPAPCSVRRPAVDARANVWYTLWNAGKIGRRDADTGEITEYSLPMPFSNPYDIWPDQNGTDMWISDAGQGGALIKFNPETEKFTYYPSPRFTDFPKLQVSRDDGVWYGPRASDRGGLGVLYPDVERIKSLAPQYDPTRMTMR